MEKRHRKFDAVLGLVVIGSLVTGFAGLIAALLAFSSYNWIGIGICLGAAALAFGLLANALLRE